MDTCDAQHPHTGDPCIHPDGHDSHDDGRGNTWTTTALAPRPEPRYVVVRERCDAAMRAVRRRQDTGSVDVAGVAAMASAVPDIPILLQVINGLLDRIEYLAGELQRAHTRAEVAELATSDEVDLFVREVADEMRVPVEG
jgi:hypothetical protein